MGRWYKQVKTIIVGGVAGGMSAATRLRRLDEQREIIVFEKGEYVSFANCGLPYYVGGEIQERDDLLLQTPAQLKARFRLDVRVKSEVVAIDPKQKKITVCANGETYDERYDDLILAPGAKPIVPAIAGLENPNDIYTIRNVMDIDKVQDAINLGNIRHATVVGAGFIGLEMVENLRKRGIEVTLIDRLSQVLAAVDVEMATFLNDELKHHKVDVRLNQEVVKIEHQGTSITLSDGSVIATDMIILAIGVRPDTAIMAAADIQCSAQGGILVDENYETNKQHIYAVGDAVVSKHWISAKPVMVALASPANRQGRQVADVIAFGKSGLNKGNLGTAIVRFFDKTLAFTGLSEKQLQALDYHYQCIHIQSKDHAGYYPGSTMIELKLLFDKHTGQLYGAQAVGEAGVDKRIDVLATAIKAKLKVQDLPELELSYAPPFGSAKDPVNMIGYAAMNLIDGLSDNVQWYEVVDFLAKGATLLDVREAEEYERGHIKTATWIPLNDLRDRIAELDNSGLIIVYCHSGLRSYIAERLLKQYGFQVKNLDGAYHLYAMMYPENIVKG